MNFLVCISLLLGFAKSGSPLLKGFSLDQLHATSLRATKRSPERFFVFEGKEGIVFNGTRYPELEVRQLPKTGVPIVVGRSKYNPKARLIFLHGLGLSISHTGSVIPTARTTLRIGNGGDKDPLATWFATQYPDLSFPVEVMAFDLPSAGWTPTIDQFPSGAHMAHYIRRVLDEILEEDNIPTFLVTRSASSTLGMMAASSKIKGIVITGSTFPDSEVLAENIRDIHRQVAKGDTVPKWEIVHKIEKYFTIPSFYHRVLLAARSRMPIRSLVGDLDGETPPIARVMWDELLQTRPNSYFRSQYILAGGAHQVFKRPIDNKGAALTTFSIDHPDIQAFKLTLDFVKHYLE